MTKAVAELLDPMGERSGDHPSGTVLLDDAEMGEVNGGSTPVCATATIVIATISQCFNDTLLWGSCRMGTRGCC
jgi:hypothetical protein